MSEANQTECQNYHEDADVLDNLQHHHYEAGNPLVQIAQLRYEPQPHGQCRKCLLQIGPVSSIFVLTVIGKPRCLAKCHVEHQHDHRQIDPVKCIPSPDRTWTFKLARTWLILIDYIGESIIINII